MPWGECMNPIYSSRRAEWMITPRSASLHAARLGIFLLMKIFPISFTAPLLAHPSSSARARHKWKSAPRCSSIIFVRVAASEECNWRRHCAMMKLTPLSEDFPALTHSVKLHAQCISICKVIWLEKHIEESVSCLIQSEFKMLIGSWTIKIDS